MDVVKFRTQWEADEGFVPHAYQDSLGYWTIGIGTLIDKRKGGGITRAEAEYLCLNRIERGLGQIEDILPWLAHMDEVRTRALLNMASQLGVGGLLTFKESLPLIRAACFADAGRKLRKSKWAVKDTPARAERIIRMIETGIDP